MVIEDRYWSGPTLPGAPKAKYVTLGCLVGTDGKVYCWGRNGWGERGIGDIPWFDGNWLPALNVSNAVKVLAREDARHRCALTQEGDLWCWGANYFGQVGNGKVNAAPGSKCEEHDFGFTCPGVYTPVKVMSDVKDFAISYDVTCAVKTNGDVYCWGSQRLGPLGNGVEVE